MGHYLINEKFEGCFDNQTDFEFEGARLILLLKKLRFKSSEVSIDVNERKFRRRVRITSNELGKCFKLFYALDSKFHSACPTENGPELCGYITGMPWFFKTMSTN